MNQILSIGESAPLGQYRGISNAAYHSGPGISKSHLDIASKTAKHYWEKYINPDHVEEEKTPALILGSAIDAAVLEPEIFEAQYIRAPDKLDRRTKEGKADWSAFLAEAGTRVVLSAEDFHTCIGARDAVLNHPVAAELVRGNDRQVAYYARHPATGLLIKCKPDNIKPIGLIDLKTTEDAGPLAFKRSAGRYRYDVQAAWYLDVVTRATGESPKNFIFVCVEKKPPYAVGIYYATSELIARGRALAEVDIQTIADGFATGVWPDYGITPQPLYPV